MSAERVVVNGVRVDGLDLAGAVNRALARVDEGGGYVCFSNTHTSVMARRDPAYRSVVEGACLNLPDGHPVYWLSRLRGSPARGAVPGPDFFAALLAVERTPPLRHYFYGARPEVLERMLERLQARLPGLVIAGREAPPFRPLSPAETGAALGRIRGSGADVVWVALGSPRQDFWMAENQEALRPMLLVGVGAAFDYLAGERRRPPSWARRAGLEWLVRLVQEPGRLWRRYLVSHGLFLAYAIRDLLPDPARGRGRGGR